MKASKRARTCGSLEDSKNVLSRRTASLARTLASIELSCESEVIFHLLKSASNNLQNNGTHESECVQELHGMIIIRLGYFTPSARNLRPEDRKGINDLLRCLNLLYQDSACRSFITPRERVEGYIIVSQLIHGASGEGHPLPSGSALKDECLTHIDMLIRRDYIVSKMLFASRVHIERVLLVLLEIGKGSKTRKALVNKLLGLLCGPLHGKVANSLATLAIDTLETTAETRNGPTYLSVHDTLFRWKCILTVKLISEPQGVEILHSLRRLIKAPSMNSREKKDIRFGVLQCLRLVKTQIRTEPNESALVHALLECAVHYELGLQLAITCLLASIARGSKQFQDRLSTAELGELLEFLVFQALGCSSGSASVPAAMGLISLLSLQTSCGSCSSSPGEHVMLALLSDLLTANIDASVTERAIEIAELLLSRNLEIRTVGSVSRQKLIHALGQASSDEFATTKVRRGAVRIFWAMVKNCEDTRTRETLPRTPKVLAALVAAASEQETDVERSKAISTLMRLSMNVCNRRILAKEAGLLSSLIRYARSLSHERNDDIAVQNGIKAQILLLAAAL